jgi:transposase
VRFHRPTRQQRAKLSRGNDVAKAMDYMIKRWIAFTRFLDDGRICLSNNAAERGVRGIALGRKSWLFCGSDRGGERAAVMYSLIVTALCRARHRQVYAARRTMPNGSGMARRCHAGIVDRVHGSPIPFGIVWSFRAPPGRRAGGRSAGSGFACRARTA